MELTGVDIAAAVVTAVGSLLTGVGALLAAWIALLIAKNQAKREEAVRIEHERQEKASRAEHNRLELNVKRDRLGIEALNLAYGFYHLLQESVYLKRRYGEHIAPEEVMLLEEPYNRFRVSARVIEQTLDDLTQRLHVLDTTDSDLYVGDIRWYWHGVVDWLVARDYYIARSRRRFLDLIRRHGQHTLQDGPDAHQIPWRVAQQLPQVQELESPDQLIGKFEELLNTFLLLLREAKTDAFLSHPNAGELS